MFRNNIIRNIRLSNIYKYNSSINQRTISPFLSSKRNYSTPQEESEPMDEYELKIYNILQQELNPVNLKLKMYQEVVDRCFQYLLKVKNSKD